MCPADCLYRFSFYGILGTEAWSLCRVASAPLPAASLATFKFYLETNFIFSLILWKFRSVYFDSIHHPPLLPCPRSPPSPHYVSPSFELSSFIFLIKSIFLLSSYPWEQGLPWSVVGLPGGVPSLTKTDFLSPRSKFAFYNYVFKIYLSEGVWTFCLHSHLYTTCMKCPRRPEEGAGLLGVASRMAVSCHVSSENWTQVF